MSDQPRLNDIDRERFAAAIEGSFAVSSRQQFFVWTQSAVFALMPHEILICGIEDGSRQGVSVHRFSSSRYFGQSQFDAVSHPLTGLMSRVKAVSEHVRSTVIFVPLEDPSAPQEHLFALVRDNELKNLAAVLVTGTSGKVDAFYAFSRIAVPLDRRLAYIIELLLPHVHSAFLRVLANEHGIGARTNQRSGRLVTPRQEEILHLIKRGKTNAEIAEVLSCSPWTIKNHVQAILRKLDSNTRTHAIARAMSLGILRPD